MTNTLFKYLLAVERNRSVYWDDASLRERACIWLLRTVFSHRHRAANEIARLQWQLKELAATDNAFAEMSDEAFLQLDEKAFTHG